MPDKTAKPSFKSTFMRAAVGLLFSAILMIPKLRRLRRNIRLWTLIRVIFVIAGAALLLRAIMPRFSAAWFVPGVILILLGALVRARPLKKSIDAVAAELGALVAVSGGTMIDATYLKEPPQVNIFIVPSSLARLMVLTSSHQRLEEIPFTSINHIARRQVDPAGPAQHKPKHAKSAWPAWDLEITWQEGEMITRFRYQGAFAAHLAEIAESTLREFWKQSLPVIAP